MQAPIVLYGFGLSGHSHRVELMLSLLALPYERVEVALSQGAHKKPEFLAKNPWGQVPVIEDGSVTLADSNAILVYLATRCDEGGRYLPRSAVEHARVQRWLSLAAGPLASGPALLRLAHVFGAKVDRPAAERVTAQLFGIMEGELSSSPWLTGDTLTLADLALYTYTAHAPEGGVTLEPYPGIRAWLARIEALPGFIGMTKSQVGLWGSDG